MAVLKTNAGDVLNFSFIKEYSRIKHKRRAYKKWSLD